MEIITTQDNNKSDLVFLLIVIKTVNFLRRFYFYLKSIILNEFEKNENKFFTNEKLKELTKIKYQDELDKIDEIITLEFIKVSQPLIVKNLNNILSHHNIDSFLIYYSCIEEIVGELQNYSNLPNLFIKAQNEYLTFYFNSKEKILIDSIDCEDWNAVQIVPVYLQKIVNFISNFKFLPENSLNTIDSTTECEKHGKDKEISVSSSKNNFSKILKIFQENEKISHEENNFISSTCNTTIKNTIDINTESYIFILTTIDICRIFYDSLKMLSFFHNSTRVGILSNLSNILNTFINLIKEIVLEGEGYRTGKLKRYSQKEISISCANVLIVNQLVNSFMKNNPNIEILIFDQLVMNLENIISLCEFNIKNLLDSTFKLTFDELGNLNFSNYPLVNNEYPVNQFVKNHFKINNIYTSMINSFDEGKISEIFLERLTNFFDNLWSTVKSLNDKNKMTDEDSLKQFKRDMLAMKSNLKTFKVLEGNLEGFRKKIDQINRLVLPKSMLKKKKTTEEEK